MAKVEQCFPYLRLWSGFGYTLYLRTFAFWYLTVCSSLKCWCSKGKVSFPAPFQVIDRRSDVIGTIPRGNLRWSDAKGHLRSWTEPKMEERKSILPVRPLFPRRLSSCALIGRELSGSNMPSRLCTRAASCGFSYQAVKFVGESRIALELFECETSRNDCWLERRSFISCHGCTEWTGFRWRYPDPVGNCLVIAQWGEAMTHHPSLTRVNCCHVVCWLPLISFSFLEKKYGGLKWGLNHPINWMTFAYNYKISSN